MRSNKKDKVKPGFFDVDEFFKYYAYSPGAEARKQYDRAKRIRNKNSKPKK